MNAIDILSIPKLDDLLVDVKSIEVGQLAFDCGSIIRYTEIGWCDTCALGISEGMRCSRSNLNLCYGKHGWETVDTNSL